MILKGVTMLTSKELWTENEILRQRLKEAELMATSERERRLSLQAELLWLKRKMRLLSEGSSEDQRQTENVVSFLSHSRSSSEERPTDLS